ncbi:MAG TPA: GNAT family N-acetyltransferase [Ruminiclostridium sp.]|nr:GNAT family N-acetyltransferase [Ruminiclostridium sp.]
MKLHFNTCSIAEVELLAQIAKETYQETFAKMNSSETMSAYLEASFNKSRLTRELKNPCSLFLFLYSDGILAGYLKVNENEAQTEFQGNEGLEVERIYLKKDFQDKGLGSFLLEKAISIAKERNKRYVWLGVWEYNLKAISFYEHKGFKKTGTHYFTMGNEKQTDYIMRKEL